MLMDAMSEFAASNRNCRSGKDLKPFIEALRRLIARWFFSMTLFNRVLASQQS